MARTATIPVETTGSTMARTATLWENIMMVNFFLEPMMTLVPLVLAVFHTIS